MDLVAARGHRHHAQRRYRGKRVQVGAQIPDHAHFQPEHGAIPLEGQLGRHHLIAPLIRGDEILAARGDPLDGPAELKCQVTGQRVFLVEESFAAEPAADIGRDDANPVLRKTDRRGQIRAHAVRALS